MVAVEAMAVGTAPVASAHGAFPELVTPGSDGALFPPTDVDALVDILADVDDHPQRWEEYGQQGRQTYRSRFSQDANIAGCWRSTASRSSTRSSSQPLGRSGPGARGGVT